MRDILFKAKRVDNGAWVEGYLFKSFTGVPYIMVQFDHILNLCESYEVDENTICQYTGLTDENKDKIWENDIVEVPGEDDYFKLEWQEDTASFVMISNSFIVTFDNYWSYDVEVVGNTFDNSDLL